MTDINSIAAITDIIILNTVNQNIPTVVFLSEPLKGDLIRNIIQKIKFSDDKIPQPDENDYTQEEWKEISDIMLKLTAIPLIIKETADVDEIQQETENFVNELNNGKGLVIITCPESADNKKIRPDNYKKEFTPKNFAIGENISIIVI